MKRLAEFASVRLHRLEDRIADIADQLERYAMGGTSHERQR